LRVMTEKHRLASEESQNVGRLRKEYERKIEEVENQRKDDDMHVDRVEKECEYLREELRKAKFKQSKDDYSSFISGLNQLRRDKNRENQPPQE